MGCSSIITKIFESRLQRHPAANEKLVYMKQSSWSLQSSDGATAYHYVSCNKSLFCVTNQ